MESGDQYGPALPPGNSNENQTVTSLTTRPSDFPNKAKFQTLLSLPDSQFYLWLSTYGLVGSSETFKCPKCGGDCKLSYRKERRVCFTFRCSKSKNHEFSVTKHSFFEKTKVDIRAWLRFVRCLLLDFPLNKCASDSGISYTKSGAEWASWIFDIFVEVVSRELPAIRFHGEVEIDEILFGAKVRQESDDSDSSQALFILGITQRDTNQLLLFPILSRDEGTIVGLIQKFVEPGSRVFTDNLPWYKNLNVYGYEHFALTHTSPEAQSYYNTSTGQTVQVSGDRAGSAWSHATNRLAKIESLRSSTFESHLCEILWRNWRRSDIFENYFKDLQLVFTYSSPPKYLSTRPIFNTWITEEEYNLILVNQDPNLKDILQQSNLTAASVPSESLVATPVLRSSQHLPPSPMPGMVVATESSSSEASSSKKRGAKVIGPSLPPGMQKSSDSDDLSEEGPLTVKMESEMSPEYSIQDDQDEDDDEDGDNQSGEAIGPMPSEMSQDGEDVVQAAEEFERRSKRMKDKLTIKAEAEEGPSKREEWMTELPPEMGKNFGLQNRSFTKGAGQSEDNKDRSSWTDTPMVKKEKEGSSKGKKRKREDEKLTSARDEQLQQQVEDYNKSKRPESLMDMHSKKLKKKKSSSGSGAATSTPADSTQATATTTTTSASPANQAGAPNTQQGQHQQQHMQQYFQLSDEIRESLDLLSEQKNQEFYGNEFNNGEFNEAKPLADLLMNPTVVGYSQEGNTFSQAQPVFSSSQMIAQAYSHAQQMSSTPAYSQVVSSTNTFSQSVPTQVAGNMNVTVVNSNQAQEVAANQNSQPQTQTIDVNGQQVQAQVANQGQITTQQVQNYAEAYAAQVSAEPAVMQQPGGQVVTFSLGGGQNMIIASPHTQQAGQNYVIQSQGAHQGQNIVIAAPGQQNMSGNFIVKTEGDELGQNIVLTPQNLQQALGQNVVLTHDGQIAAAPGTENVVLTTSDGQQRHQIQGARQIQPAPQPQQVLTQAGIPLQAGGGQIPQVSLVLPPVNSLFPQIQASSANFSPQAFLQLSAKMDKLMGMVKDSQTTLFEMNKRVERIENHLFPQPVAISSATPAKPKPKPKPIVPGSSTPTATTTTTNTGAAVTKASLKAALSNYLTISDYTATDELKRSDSNSDLFIPVGTVSMMQGQGMIEAPSPSETPETASSTVQEVSSEQDLIPVVLGNMANPVNPPVATPDINVPIVDSQSGIAVTVYDEGNENQKFELGPGSGKEPNARFSNTSANPKTVILDPRFWEILVEDFQKNMSSDQIISAMSSTRKPLVRSIGTSEISICSTVLKEAESACQGRRERLAKELVFRIFTLGEVYDRNVSGVFYINGKKMENKNKALDPAKMAAIHYLVMKYPPSVVDNPRLERLVWKNCVDRINDALRRIYNWIHKIVDVNNIIDKLPTDSIMMH